MALNQPNVVSRTQAAATGLSTVTVTRESCPARRGPGVNADVGDTTRSPSSPRSARSPRCSADRHSGHRSRSPPRESCHARPDSGPARALVGRSGAAAGRPGRHRGHRRDPARRRRPARHGRLRSTSGSSTLSVPSCRTAPTRRARRCQELCAGTCTPGIAVVSYANANFSDGASAVATYADPGCLGGCPRQQRQDHRLPGQPRPRDELRRCAHVHADRGRLDAAAAILRQGAARQRQLRRTTVLPAHRRSGERRGRERDRGDVSACEWDKATNKGPCSRRRRPTRRIRFPPPPSDTVLKLHTTSSDTGCPPRARRCRRAGVLRLDRRSERP